MARILIFDSSPSLEGNPYDQSPLGDAGDIKRSAPVRLFTHEGHIPNVSFEFLMVDQNATLDLRWYQEFYTDHTHMGMDGVSARGTTGELNRNAPRPTQRDFPGATSAMTWAREQVAIVGAGGAIAHFDALRSMTLTDNQARYFPMEVHSLWMRLAVYAIAPVGNTAVRIWANVAGLAESKWLREQTVPYNYAVQIT